ncbi:Six-hairpin glycosidase-like protein [Colletotrichum karsti]|uniref:Six-hairpin glycosidase-like protein n=1 Tax=Colletotrichum karsti TaxID=1095194 RepID=A0A9P6I4F7_9PEZI|nr:Six-hairpin glycosidase-like protein [Colletotrichum karsti]KAF9873816.1 Six-hairpin glycosidase-like protein [Colletotrichum karsti]
MSDYDNDAYLKLNRTTDEPPAFVLDFGIEVGGIISFSYDLQGVENASVGLAFTEAKDFIGRNSDSSRGGSGGRPGDGPWLANMSASTNGYYVMPDERIRGGFRYLTIFLETPGTVVSLGITNVTLDISFQPTWSNLRAYKGYFHSEDELLNKIWYSGAYTVQTNSVPGNTGQNALGNSVRGWRNNAVITTADTVLLDGAKRDRFVWIGDMGTAVPSAFVGTGELESTKHALLAIFDNQASFPAIIFTRHIRGTWG